MPAGGASALFPSFSALARGVSGTSAIASLFFVPPAPSSPPPQPTERASTGRATRAVMRSRAVVRGLRGLRGFVLGKVMRRTLAAPDDGPSMAT